MAAFLLDRMCVVRFVEPFSLKTVGQFVVPKPRPEAASRLFCFPHAGSGPAAFFDWPMRLGPEVECVFLQYAGRGSRFREKPWKDVDNLVQEIAHDFPGWEDKPFAFYGHSFGGVVAFELARYLKQAKDPQPDHLFVGATRAPHLESPHPPLRDLDDRSFVDQVQARYGGIPEAIFRDPDVLELFLPAMRADFAAYETYPFRWGEPLDIPISAFGGANDKAVTLESIRKWALHTTAAFDMNVLPCGHFFTASSVNNLIRSLQNCIARDLNGKSKQVGKFAGKAL